MRKILMVVAVAALAVMLAAPAMAVDWQFGGKARVRFYDYSALGFDSSQGTNPGNNIRGADMLFRVKMTFSDDNQNILAVLQLRWGKIVFGNGGAVENPVNFPSMQNWLNADTGGNIGNYTNPGVRAGASSGGGFGLRDINVEMEQAYLDFQVPWGVPLRIRMGGQPWYEPKGLIVDDAAMGVRGYGKAGIFNYEAAWYRLDAGNRYGDNMMKTELGIASRYRVDSIDNNWDVIGAKVGANFFPWLNPAVYYYYSMNDTVCQPGRTGSTATNTSWDNMGTIAGAGSLTSTTVQGPICPGTDRQRPMWTIGLTDTGKFGDLSYDLDFVYESAQGGAAGTYYPGIINATAQTMNLGTAASGLATPSTPAPLRVQGWVIDAGAHYAWGPFTFNLVGSYASGDDGSGSGTSKAFPGGFSPGWNGPGGFFDLIGNGAGAGQFDIITATESSPTGLWTIGGYATYNPVKAWTLKAGVAYAGWTSKWANCAWAGDGSNGAPAYANGPASPAGATGLSETGASCYGPVLFGKGYQSNRPGTGGNNSNIPSGGLVGKSSLGTELNLKADWQVYTGFKVQGVAAWLFPTAGDTVQKYAIQFVYDF
ncbi:MAG TPA: hypothetical protein VMD08_01490 [Candidatus Baltobacteraceae bacterium]|nr:hypothetical protein [Candidatus Baltobacteraceae bacterium]